MARIGFNVKKWENKPFGDFTNEELLEYWHRLRTTCPTGEIDTKDYSREGLSTELYVANLQMEILDRMKR